MYIIETRKGSFLFWWTGSSFSDDADKAKFYDTDLLAHDHIKFAAINAKSNGMRTPYIREA